MNKQQLTGIIIALVAALGILTSVSAHAELEQSEPAAGAKLASAPTKLTLKFSEEISEKATDSYFTVTDAKGTNVGSGQLDTTDLDHHTLSGTLSAGTGDGVYTVSWFTVTTDDNGHSDGAFTFGVNVDPGAQPTAKPHTDDDDAATAAPTAASAPQPTLAPTTATTPQPTATAAVGATATSPTPTITAPGLPNTGGESSNRGWLLLISVLVVIAAVGVRRLATRS